MKNKINKLLKEIEKEKNIKIVFAVESGSRAWGMESANSDYDVRFLYVRKKEEYLKINLADDVITKTYDKDLKPSRAAGCFVDVMGFDIFKFAKMLIKSNPTCIEWLQSDIIYLGKKPKMFEDFAINNFNPIAMYYHYKSMCNQNYKKYIDSGNEVTYKKYLYAMRGLVNAQYIVTYASLPSIKFPEVLKEIRNKSIVPNSVITELETIIKLKKELREKEIVQNYKHMDEYIELFLKEVIEFKLGHKEIKEEVYKKFNKEILKEIDKRR